jgi:hypothetical protein
MAIALRCVNSVVAQLHLALAPFLHCAADHTDREAKALIL